MNYQTYTDFSPLAEMKKALQCCAIAFFGGTMQKSNPEGINQYTGGMSAHKETHTRAIRDKFGLRHVDAEGLYNQGYRVSEDGDLYREAHGGSANYD